MKDYKVMNALYNCAANCASSPKTCGGGGFQNPNDCSKCICPPGVGGPSCTAPLASPIHLGYAPPGITNNCQGGNITVSGTAWTTLTKSIGSNSWTANTANQDVAWCHWYLLAPANFHLQIELQSVNGYYGPGCGAGFTEVRVSNSKTVADWAKTGRR